MGSLARPDQIAEIERELPTLKTAPYAVTSERTTDYNCIAFAVGRDDEWWDPYNAWPDGVPREVTLPAYLAAFATEGFEVCATAELEPSFEKVAIYVYTGTREPSHAAKQLPDGRWKSKLGNLEDVEHDTLEQLVGSRDYGDLAAFLRRKR
jgi:hypothetical protein